MLKEIVIAFQSLAQAHQFVKKNNLKKWILLPGLIYAILFIAGMIFFWDSANGVVTWVSGQLRIEPWLQKQRSEWLSFFFLMMGIMLRLVLLLFYFSLFKYIILIIGSPVFTYLSKKTTEYMSDKKMVYSREVFLKDFYRSTRLCLRNMGWQSVYMLALMLLSLIPVIGWGVPIAAILLEAYYFGFSMIDYSLSRNRIELSKSIRFNSEHPGLAIGNGFIFYFMHIIIILAPAYAIIAASLSIHKVKSL